MTKISAVWKVNRRIKVPELINSNDKLLIEQAMSKLTGLESMDIDINKQQLTVNYDASQLNFSTITKILHHIGKPPINNFWARVKASWYDYTDTNAKENANAPPPICCNKPPSL